MRLRVGEGGGRLERDGVQEGSLRLRGGERALVPAIGGVLTLKQRREKLWRAWKRQRTGREKERRRWASWNSDRAGRMINPMPGQV